MATGLTFCIYSEIKIFQFHFWDWCRGVCEYVGVEGNLMCVLRLSLFFAHLKGCVNLWCLSLTCVCFDCVCLSICTYKTESLCGHIKVLTHPEHIGRDFYKGFAFIVVDHPPWEMIHTCTDLKMVWKHTHTYTPVHIQIDFISSLHTDLVSKTSLILIITWKEGCSLVLLVN